MWTVETGSGTVSASLDRAAQGSVDAVIVCAHGAGGNMNDRAMSAAAAAMREAGLDVLRFNFPYSERRTGRPDPMPVLQAAMAAVADHVRSDLAPRRLFLGGRSMGGRAASMLAAGGYACDGLILLAYPLHPAGRPEQRRVAHLPAINVPVLCFNGTRDALCTPALMEEAVRTVHTSWRMHWLEGADHGFHVLKRSGRSDGDVLHEIADVTRHWVETLAGR